MITIRKKISFAVTFVLANWLSFLTIILCTALCVLMLNYIIPKKGGISPIADVRYEVYEKGTEAAALLSTQDSMIELSRIYASGSDIKTSVYYTMIDDLGKMCETAPEERLFEAVRGIVGLELDAAALYSDMEFELSAQFQKKAAELNERLASASTYDELEAISVAAGKFRTTMEKN